MLSWFRRWRAARAKRAAEAAATRAADDARDDADDADDAGDEPDADAVVEVALTNELDLHNFLPKECADVVDEYLRAAQEAGFTAVRIIHGKGTGTLRRIVHSVLERHPAVRAYKLAGKGRGSWGVTVVELKPPESAAPPPPPPPIT